MTRSMGRSEEFFVSTQAMNTTLEQRIKVWLARRQIRYHGGVQRDNAAELGVFHGPQLAGEIRVIQIDGSGNSFQLVVIKDRFELEDYWGDAKSFEIILDAALNIIQKRLGNEAPDWSVHLI